MTIALERACEASTTRKSKPFPASPSEIEALSTKNVEKTVQLFRQLVPTANPILQLNELQIGTSKSFWKVRAGDESYLLQQFKEPLRAQSFAKLAAAAQLASREILGPRVLAVDPASRTLVLEQIDAVPWPRFELDAIPYLESMRALRAFHQLNLRSAPPFSDAPDQIFPFHFIATKCSELFRARDVPRHFFVALKKIIDLFEQMRPWMETFATVCHGDFHRKNVLLTQEMGVWKATLIGFDFCELGHPYYDIAKFCMGLTKQQRLALFKEYLGEKQPNLQDIVHLEANHLALLMIVATTCLLTVLRSSPTDGDLPMSFREMEQMLDANDPLPSFIDVLRIESTLRQKQLGAVYALAELLRKVDFLPI